MHWHYGGIMNDEQKLIEQAKAGNQQAFTTLVNTYQPKVMKIISRYVHDYTEIQDLAQETFLKAFNALDKFRGDSQFYTWLYRIAVNTTLTHMKRNRYRRFFSFETLQEEGISDEFVAAFSSGAESDKPTFLKELQEKLNEALQKLSPKHRTVVVLFEIEGLSHQEIADVMKCSEGTVRSRLHYAKQQLQGYLKEYLR